MFGYIIANTEILSEEQLNRYRGCYCGLCRSLKERHGELSRFTLNYDMTFLVMLLSSLYEPQESSGCRSCFVHPMKKREFWKNRFSDYAADMNVALAYFSLLDKWCDDKNILGLAEAKALEKSYKKIKEEYPVQCNAIENCTSRLGEIEKNYSSNPDEATNCFGELMGTIFAVGNDRWNDYLHEFGKALGRFIYMMDACVDLEKDKKRGSYNPLIAMGKADISNEEKTSFLTLLIGECTEIFEKMPLINDVDIMRNVLYCGVWGQYAAMLKKRGDVQANE